MFVCDDVVLEGEKLMYGSIDEFSVGDDLFVKMFYMPSAFWDSLKLCFE